MNRSILLALALAVTGCSQGLDDTEGEALNLDENLVEGLVRFDVYPPQDSGLADDRGQPLPLRPQTFVEDLSLGGSAQLLMTPAIQVRGTVEGEALTPWPTAEVPSVQDFLLDAELRFGLEGNIQQPRTETNADGEYEVFIVPSDVPYEVAVVPSTPDVPVYTERINIDGGASNVDIFVDAGVPLWGTVSDGDGEPMEGLVVSAIDENGLEGASVTTDVNGRYVLTVGAGQAYTVQFAPSDRTILPTVTRRTEVVEGQGLEVPVVFDSTAISGVGGPVFSPSGDLVARDDVRVRLIAEQIDGFEPGEATFEVEVGTDDGRFATFAPRGSYRVEVAPQDPDGASPLVQEAVRVGSSATTVNDLDLVPKTARVGVVSDDTGQRVGGATVTCTEVGFAERTWSTTSDPAGDFVLSVPLTETTCAIAPPSDRADDLALTQQRLEGDDAFESTAEWTLVIATGREITGQILARREARMDAPAIDPLPASVIEVRDFSGQLLGVGVSDADGEFRVRIAR